MRIEKINDNQLRFRLSRSDLEKREIKLSELAYGTPKAKALLQELMQWAEFKFNFTAQDIPLMFEAIPNPPDEILLIVSKMDPKDAATFLNPPEILEGSASELGTDAKTPSSRERQNTVIPLSPPIQDHSLFHFDNLSLLLAATSSCQPQIHLSSDLYRESKDDSYYLLLNRQKASAEAMQDTASILSEFGQQINLPKRAELYLAEHWECILAEQAIERLRELTAPNP